MKKTLIALAALASTAAFAQSVTLSGNYTAGWTSDKTAAGVRTAGLSTDTARLQADASEDLGGGLKVKASVSVANLNRSATKAGGENAYIQLDGGFGSVKVGSVETGGAYDLAMGNLQQGYGMDGKVLAGNVTLDTAAYTLPKFGDVTVAVSIADYTTDAANAGSAGWSGTAIGQPSSKVAASYASGPLSASAAYVAYGRKELSTDASKAKTVLGAQYDLGAAKLGFATYRATKETSLASSASSYGVSVPMGAVTLGANYTVSKTYSGTTLAKKSGTVLGANYALSKRTNLGVSTYSWKTVGTAGNNTGFRVLLGHSF